MARLAAALILGASLAAAEERTLEELAAEAARLYGQGELERAVETLREAARVATASGAGPEERGAVETTLALVLNAVGRKEEAEAHMRRGVEALEDAMSPLDQRLAYGRVGLAAIEADNGKLDEAALHACTALGAVQGAAPAVEVACLTALGRISFGRRQYGVAHRLLCLAAERAIAAGLPRRDCLDTWRALAGVAMLVGTYDVAEKTLEDLRADHEAGGPTPSAALEWARLLTELRIKQRRLAEAQKIADGTLERAAHVAGSLPIDYAALTITRAKIALEKGELEHAGEWLARAEPALRRPGYDARSELASLLETRGELRHRRKDAAGARADLEEALALRARHGENGLGAARVLLALAELESGEGAHAKAMDYAARATRIYLREIGALGAEGGDACRAYGKLRARAMEAGLKEADVPVLRGVRVNEGVEADADATDAIVRKLYGRAGEMAAQDGAGALALLDEAVALRPGECHGARALALDQLKRHEEAIAAWDAEIGWSLTPKPLAYLRRARDHLRLFHHDQVIVDATYALLLGEETPEAHLCRGISGLTRDGHAELALRDLDVCFKADPKNAHLQYLRGLALWSLCRFDDAAEALRVACGSDKLHSRACAKLAEVERCRGNAEEALAQATTSIDDGAKDLDAYGVRGFVHLDRADWRAALADFEAWAGDDPPSLYGRILQWICRAHLGERDAAADVLRSAVNGDDQVAHVARAILGEGPESPADAPMPSRRAERAAQCRAHLLLGAWREVEGDLKGARAHYGRAVAMSRPDVVEHQSAAVALARLGAAK